MRYLTDRKRAEDALCDALAALSAGGSASLGKFKLGKRHCDTRCSLGSAPLGVSARSGDVESFAPESSAHATWLCPGLLRRITPVRELLGRRLGS